MYPPRVRERALALRAEGASWAAVAVELGVAKSTVLQWARDPDAWRRRLAECPLCGEARLPQAEYAALLGYYLGDGHISRAPRYYCLRITSDARHVGIIDDITQCIQAIRPAGKTFRARHPGAVDVGSNWQHWPCLFPQHGPGRKHDRPIILDDWQRRIVEDHPGSFLRGLFHSDGCRVINSTRKMIGGEMKRYTYSRWQFCNASTDIRELCCWALDLVDIPWRQSNVRVISVSRRDAVAHLDELIGPKS